MYEALALQVLEITIAGIEGLLLPIAQVARRDDAEGANRRERARLGAAQGDVMVTDAHAFTVGTSWQIEVLHEHIAEIERGALARIRRATTTALAQLTPMVAVSIAGVVRPTRIEVHRDLLRETVPGARLARHETPRGVLPSRVWPLLAVGYLEPPSGASLRCGFGVAAFVGGQDWRSGANDGNHARRGSSR